MIQFNLLPSVKLEYIKANRTKRLVMATAVIASIAAILIFTLLFVNVNIVQSQHISNLTNEIEESTAQLKEVEDIDKVLTVQNQLNALTALHEQKPASARTLSYLRQITPQSASISDASIDFEENTFAINGTADSLVSANKFIDTLKFTKYTVGDSSDQQNAFSEVVLSSFSVDEEQATYQIDFKYQPEIFDNTKKITLIIPNVTTTRSETQKPGDDLFQPQPNDQAEGIDS